MLPAVASTMINVPSATAVVTCCAVMRARVHSTWHAAVRLLKMCSEGLPPSVCTNAVIPSVLDEPSGHSNEHVQYASVVHLSL